MVSRADWLLAGLPGFGVNSILDTSQKNEEKDQKSLNSVNTTRILFPNSSHINLPVFALYDKTEMFLYSVNTLSDFPFSCRLP